MQVLKRGHTELFRRGPDECYASLADLTAYCQEQKAKSVDRCCRHAACDPGRWHLTAW